MSSSPLRTVAYVDDEPDIREVVRLSLSIVGGLTVHCFPSGTEALSGLPALGADLILLDVMMPDLDGAELLRRLRTHEALRDTPVIFMTAKAMPEEVAQFRALGAIGVIPKPFDPMQLAKRVTDYWSEHVSHD